MLQLSFFFLSPASILHHYVFIDAASQFIHFDLCIPFIGQSNAWLGYHIQDYVDSEIGGLHYIFLLSDVLTTTSRITRRYRFIIIIAI